MDEIKKDVEDFLKIFAELLPITITETDTTYNIEFQEFSISDKWEVEIDKEMLKEIYKLFIKDKK